MTGDADRYLALEGTMEVFLSSRDPVLSNLANFVALLKEAFGKISWVGFYILKDGLLHVGPFQGKVACSPLRLDRGICAACATSGKTVVVEDVTRAPGHIACDAAARSEIVVPVFTSPGHLFGVLDVDSHELNAFSNLDRDYLEKFCGMLTARMDLASFRI